LAKNEETIQHVRVRPGVSQKTLAARRRSLIKKTSTCSSGRLDTTPSALQKAGEQKNQQEGRPVEEKPSDSQGPQKCQTAGIDVPRKGTRLGDETSIGKVDTHWENGKKGIKKRRGKKRRGSARAKQSASNDFFRGKKKNLKKGFEGHRGGLLRPEMTAEIGLGTHGPKGFVRTNKGEGLG